MAIDPDTLDPRLGQASRLLGYLPAIYQEREEEGSGSPSPVFLARFLMAVESLFLGLPKSRREERADLLYQPGLEEIIGGAVEQGSSETLLVGIQRYFNPGSSRAPDPEKIIDHDQAPSEFLAWLAGWVALTLRDDWSDQHKRSFIANAAQLYRLRGTKAGVLQFLKIYIGDNPRVELSELTDRFQIGVHSRVGVDTYLDGGSPFYFRVRVVLGIEDLQKQMDILNSLIDLQKPAHTFFDLEPITVRFQIGVTSTIGVDTLLGVPLN
jgi:phage tail-like protein